MERYTSAELADMHLPNEVAYCNRQTHSDCTPNITPGDELPALPSFSSYLTADSSSCYVRVIGDESRNFELCKRMMSEFKPHSFPKTPKKEIRISNDLTYIVPLHAGYLV
ncbi:hypothetical protein TNCV_2118701 [Trichonephila clavipes]|nr:hypothetical protein TNCV_2118701 [Trichonephila clavipes]